MDFFKFPLKLQFYPSVRSRTRSFGEQPAMAVVCFDSKTRQLLKKYFFEFFDRFYLLYKRIDNIVIISKTSYFGLYMFVFYMMCINVFFFKYH